jgi:hypothetical protein
MRDLRFIAKHRGGLLDIQQHRSLIKWSYQCVEHAISILDVRVDDRLLHALAVAKAWQQGNAKTGEAMKAAVASHAVARESSDPVAVAIARAVGHAVATAHMADHSLGAALYSLKAIKAAGYSVEEERKWQNQHVPADLSSLPLRAV